MPTNPYFQNSATISRSEQDLINALTVESIQIHGSDFLYMPRKIVDADALFGEDPTSEYKKAFEIEMYIETPTDYAGEGEFLSKFGFENRKEITVNVSVTRFQESVGIARPFEGDWLWHPVTGMLFEVAYCEDEPILWQLGNQYTYKLTLKVAEYSHENIETGYEEVDKLKDAFYNDGTDSNGLVNDQAADNDTIIQNDDYTNFDETSPFGKA